jgi:hypothetical protein
MTSSIGRPTFRDTHLTPVYIARSPTCNLPEILADAASVQGIADHAERLAQLPLRLPDNSGQFSSS